MAGHSFNFGSTIRLQHKATGRFLASFDEVYTHPNASGQSMAVGVQFADDERSRWSIHGRHDLVPDPADSSQPLQSGCVVRLTNDRSGRNLHSHDSYAAPVSTGRHEVTTIGTNGTHDLNDNWNLTLVSQGSFTRGAQVRLQHTATTRYLHCSSESHATFTAGQLEVSAVQEEVDSTIWILQDGAVDWPISAPPDAVVSEIERRLNEAREIHTKANEALAKIAALHADAASKSRDVDDGAKFAADTRTTLTNIAQEAETLVDGVNTAQTRLQQAAEQASVSAGQANACAATTREHEAIAKSSMETAATLAGKADRVSAEIAGYETRLKEFEAGAAELKTKIENLLAGATSVGLGMSFGERANSFRRAARFWQGAVLVSLVSLIAVATYGIVHFINLIGQDGKTIPYEPWKLVALLPIVGPLVWLILHLQRQAATTKRLEEEYAFKEAVSKSFEGYKKQIADMRDSLVPDGPLAKYYASVLEVITTEPGRIYEKHRPDVSPLTALAESAPKIARALKDTGEVVLSVKPK